MRDAVEKGSGARREQGREGRREGKDGVRGESEGKERMVEEREGAREGR